MSPAALRCLLTVAFRSDSKQQKDTRVHGAFGAHTRIEIARDDPPAWPTRPHAPMMSSIRCPLKLPPKHRRSRSRRSPRTSMRGRFGPHPRNMPLQNLQADPGTTICCCAIEENPTQKIRSARRLVDARNAPRRGGVREGGRNDRCGARPTNIALVFEGHIEEKLYTVQTSRTPYRPLLHRADLQAKFTDNFISLCFADVAIDVAPVAVVSTNKATRFV